MIPVLFVVAVAFGISLSLIVARLLYITGDQLYVSYIVKPLDQEMDDEPL